MNEIIELFNSIEAIYHCNNCNNDFDLLDSNLVNKKYIFVCPYCFSKDYKSYNDLESKNNKKVYTDMISKTLKSLRNIKVKNYSKKLIKSKISNQYKGFVYFFYDKSNFKIIPLHNINPYLYIKDLKKLYKLELPNHYINGKPIFNIYIRDSCSKDNIIDINKNLDIKNAKENKVRFMKELNEKIKVYGLKKLDFFWIKMILLFSFIFMIEYYIILLFI